MTQPESTPPVPDQDQPPLAVAEDAPPPPPPEEAESAAEGEVESQPEPLPWTPERVLEWNAYYDIYVMLAVLLLTFVVSSLRVDENNPSLWTHLKTGELTAQQGFPVVTDVFSYSEPGTRWVNIPWLFQWGHAALFKLVQSFVPVDPADPTANQGAAEQVATGVLIGLNALVRLLTAWILLKIRRPGPGLWWSAVCVAFALGSILGFADSSQGFVRVVPGGIAGPGMVTPGTWGMLALALEMLLLHRAFFEGRRRALYFLVPLFLLWANFDESFIVGLLILAAASIGRLLDGTAIDLQHGESPSQADIPADKHVTAAIKPVSGVLGLVVLAVGMIACLANPSTFRVFLGAAAPILSFFGPKTEAFPFSELSYFGSHIQKQFPDEWYWQIGFYVVMVAVGLVSFLLNARRFAWSRFLPFVAVSVLWALMLGYRQEFAIVFAAVAAINGQEWYHGRFGTQGRLGLLPTIWSTGGRLVTLAVLFFCVSVGITGWGRMAQEPRFGFSYEPNDFAFEAAEFLARQPDIKKNVLNTTTAQGDALIWKAYPVRRTFIDSRTVFTNQDREEHRKLRVAIRDDAIDEWRPVFDRYDISAVMIELAGAGGASETYKRLSQSPNWIPFYDDGRIVIFGRADAAEPDLTTFKNNRLQPDLRAYHVAKAIPAADRPPTPTSWIDDFFKNRLAGRPQVHTHAAVRWLQGGNVDADQPTRPDPARCLLAIREARTATAKNPDDWVAYRLLNTAYRILAQSETALLAGMPLDRQNQNRVNALSSNYDLLAMRYRQRVTALNYAILTTPTPKTPEARQELQSLNLELFELYRRKGFVDKARDALQSVIDSLQPGDASSPELESQLRQQLEQLTQQVRQVEDYLMDMQVERQAGPVEKAAAARSRGAIGLAITELEEANRGNMSPLVVKPQLVDLYCLTGQPDRALEFLSASPTEDPNLGTEPGSSFNRQGLVYLLMGNYATTENLWRTRAIPRLRFDRSQRVISMGQFIMRGEMVHASNLSMVLPGLVNRQGLWEFELGLCMLESGSLEGAAETLTHALKLVPDLAFRPIIAYYLQKMGKPVPEKPSDTTKQVTTKDSQGKTKDGQGTTKDGQGTAKEVKKK